MTEEEPHLNTISLKRGFCMICGKRIDPEIELGGEGSFVHSSCATIYLDWKKKWREEAKTKEKEKYKNDKK